MKTSPAPSCGVAALACLLACAPARTDANALADATARAHELNRTFTEPMAPGPFAPTWASLSRYEIPAWFADAKFGIWAHWGPQCQPELQDWYARHLYEQTPTRPWAKKVYPFHVGRYGHPSVFGFKDVINTWWAERWDPAKLLALYQRAGAQYFMALANHHDNFDLWDSRYQPWNATRVGPKKDIIAGWAKAARAVGLRFGVSVHASRAWTWYETAQGSDSSGPLAGVPYDGKLTAADGQGKWWDGLDPQDLYAQNHPVSGASWRWAVKEPPAVEHDPRLPDEVYVNKFYNRVADLINQVHPDMIYFDDEVLPLDPISDVGLRLTAHLYNDSVRQHGKLEAVVTGKHLSEEQKRCLVYDIERGRSTEILPRPWQTDTCLGGWHYDRSVYEQQKYASSASVIQLLADVVSKNGNLMLSVPLRGDGTLDDSELRIVTEIGDWMEINRESIFGTRPWKVYGEGPSTADTQPKGDFGGLKDFGEYTSADVRYTQAKDGKTLYALVLGVPGPDVALTALGRKAGHLTAPVTHVERLGSDQPVKWTQGETSLVLTTPPPTRVNGAFVYRITLAPL